MILVNYFTLRGLQKKLSSSISNPKIDQIYEYMISKGALGGKLLGAGGGGFLLFYMKNLQKSFLKKIKTS